MAKVDRVFDVEAVARLLKRSRSAVHGYTSPKGKFDPEKLNRMPSKRKTLFTESEVVRFAQQVMEIPNFQIPESIKTIEEILSELLAKAERIEAKVNELNLMFAITKEDVE